jgi:gliding motility-associated-like protein
MANFYTPSFFRIAAKFTVASILISFLSFPSAVRAQLIVTTPVTADDIVQKLLGCASTASNITFASCGTSAGFFNAVNTNLGIDSGVLISSGDANLAVGPNNSGSQTSDNGCPGNSLLQALCGQPTYNAAVLDFDVVLNTDSLKFNYVFASEEYPEWVGTIFNDVFALWISGPGIIGQQNMAVLPGTPYPVTISNVNCTIGNGSYYVCNDPFNTLCPATFACPTSSSATTIQYDGLTTVLEAKHAVTPGETYHLQFAIADAGDAIYDSGVFIEADFLEQYKLDILADTGNFINPLIPGDTVSTIVEGCEPAVLHFNLAAQNLDTVVVPLIIGGTAVMGTDYTSIQDTLVFLPYDSSEVIFIGALIDGLPEGTETIVLYSLDACSGLYSDSIEIKIIDDFPFEVTNDTTICENTSIDLWATFSPYYSYTWLPNDVVDCDTCATTVGTPGTTTLYIVEVGLGSCLNYDTVAVEVNEINPDAGLDIIVCIGDSTQLNATGGVAYSWSPSAGLSNPSIPNPVANPTTTTVYTVQVQGTYALCYDYDSVMVTIVPNLVGMAGSDTTVCSTYPATLWASGGDYYAWTPNVYIDDTSSSSPTVNPFEPTTYQVMITNIYGCVDSQEVFVNVFPYPVITLNQPYEIFYGETAQLFAHAGVGSSYEWNPIRYLSSSFVYNPVSAPDSSIEYFVKITTAQGCVYYDTTSVKVIYETLVSFPNAFTPNNDGVNDLFTFIARGPFELESFKVYDRWGTTVFASDNFNEGWDGNFKGKAAEVGTYVFTLDGRDGNGVVVNRKGAFVLLR